MADEIRNSVNAQGEEKKSSVSPAKRVLAIIAVVLIIALYVVGLVFAFIGKGYSVAIVMSCILIASYLAVYFHAGQVLTRLLKKRKERHKGEEQDGEADNTTGV